MTSSVSGQMKTSFKFNEVTSMTGVKPYVLRFWESEFDQINPKTNEIGQKLYGPLDIEAVEKVKKLLFEDKLSIPQAKGYLDRLVSDQESDQEFDQVFNQSSETGFEANQFTASSDLNNDIDGNALFDGHEEMSLKSRSLDLKKALEQIIEKNSAPISSDSITVENEVTETAENIVELVEKDNGKQRHLLDKDVVNLVSAKKKLSVLTARIDEICLRNEWH